MHKTPLPGNYGTIASRYIKAQKKVFDRIGFPLVGRHGEDILARAVAANVVTLHTLEAEDKPLEAHNQVLAQLALHHPFKDPRYLPDNLPPNHRWIREEHEVFCQLRDLDRDEKKTIQDYQSGPLSRRIHGLPPLAFLLRMVDLTTLSTPELLAQLPSKHNQYFPQYDDMQEVARNGARRALELYAPFAEGFGFGKCCRDLKNWAVGYVYPDRTKVVKMQYAELSAPKAASDMLLGQILGLLREDLPYIDYRIRNEKSLGSSVIKIEKAPEKYSSIRDFHDLSAAFIIVETQEQVYQVIAALMNSADGLIHKVFQKADPAPDDYELRLEDYIMMPKPGSLDGYRSAHIDIEVARSSERDFYVNLELIIRTREMHEACEKGTAAHWLYKGEKSNPKEQKKSIDNYDRLLLSLAAGAAADPKSSRNLGSSLLLHERPVRVTFKCKTGKEIKTIPVTVQEGHSIVDALVRANIDISNGVTVQERNLSDSINREQTIVVSVGLGVRKLKPSFIRQLLKRKNSIRTPQAITALSNLLYK
ncbi:hypothetical protein HY988_07300 [Candidatus Micrarchaeota archaeon]|nr:hypothetical protein [Candidatus Micrarchaeota archaeon]